MSTSSDGHVSVLPDPCRHNNRCRYTDGYFCEDCKTFFPKDSAVYRRTELPLNLIIVLHNLRIDLKREGKDASVVLGLFDKFRKTPSMTSDDLDALVAEAEQELAKHGLNSDSASITLG